MFYVRSKGDTGATRAQLAKLLPQYSIRSLAEYVSLMNSSNLPQLRPFTRTMVALGIVISFIVVLLNMHTMVMERTREIGILKALGFSRFAVVRMLLTETFILALFGTGLGIALTFLTQFILKETKPDLRSSLPRPGFCLRWRLPWSEPPPALFIPRFARPPTIPLLPWLTSNGFSLAAEGNQGSAGKQSRWPFLRINIITRGSWLVGTSPGICASGASIQADLLHTGPDNMPHSASSSTGFEPSALTPWSPRLMNRSLKFLSNWFPRAA